MLPFYMLEYSLAIFPVACVVLTVADAMEYACRVRCAHRVQLGLVANVLLVFRYRDAPVACESDLIEVWTVLGVVDQPDRAP